MKPSAFDYSVVADPRIFAQNRLPAHSDHIYYECEPGDCQYSLNGQWKFAFAENYEKSIKGFEDPGYDCHGWEEIPVPAHIQLHGCDAPQYVNTQYPWDGHEAVRPGQVPVRFNPTASYVKYFEVPSGMRGRELFISFQGVESAFSLWMNGHYVGYSEDSFTPADFELTPFLTEGENKLAVLVFKWSSGSWCEDQDFFRFSGIFRDVFLYVKPRIHVEDMRIRTLLADLNPCENAKLEIELYLSVRKGPDPFSALTCTLADGDGAVACSTACAGSGAEGRPEDDPAAAANAGPGESADSGAGDLYPFRRCRPSGEIRRIRICADIPSPRLWSAEDPYLYDLTVALKDKEGRTVETVTEKVGFRRFEIRGARMLLNGKRIVFRGVNRHEFCARSGRVIDEEMILKDLVTMKRNNINAVRLSHYPNRTQLYRLCDRLGLYVIDETNLETHGTWDAIEKGKEDIPFAVPGNRPEFREMILDRANSMYQRDKNHPCILIWSCGNESFGGSILQEEADFFREMECVRWEGAEGMDFGRAVHYEGVFHDRRFQVSDMESTMYIPVDQIREYLKEHRDRPYISCEYAHAMGNSCGALEKYTTLTEEEPLYQGGFIWDYIDQCLEMKDRYGNTFLSYGGDHGDRPHDGNFSGNGLVYGDDREPTPKMQEVKFCYQGIRISFEGPDGERIPSGGCLRRNGANRSRLPGPADDSAGASEGRGEIRGKDRAQPAQSLRVVISNKNLFTATDAYDCTLSVMREGEEILRTPWLVSVGADHEQSFDLPEQVLEAIWPSCRKETVLTVSFALREDTLWAKAGHEVAYGQLAVRNGSAGLHEDADKTAGRVKTQDGGSGVRYSEADRPGDSSPEADDLRASRLEVVRGWNNIGVRTGSFEMLFSELLGGLISVRCDGRELLDKMVLPNFWRALTDNDVANQLADRAGVWKAGSAFISHKYDHGRSYVPCRVELSGGKDCVEQPDREGVTERSDQRVGMGRPDCEGGTERSGQDGGAHFLSGFGSARGCEWVKITCTYYPAVPAEVRCTLAYIVYADGRIDVEQTMPDTSLLGQLPEFSVLWPLSADLDRVTWYGPGPEETYRDKIHGKLGIWGGSAAEQMARYLRPQECGWKENARWARVTDASGRGLVFEMEPDTGLGFSALPFSPQELDNADHPCDLPSSRHTWVRVGQQMGVGGDDTWGALVHPEYLLDNTKEMKIRFRVRVSTPAG